MIRPRYAAETAVSVERSQGEIRQALKAQGADDIVPGEMGGRLFVLFRLLGVTVRVALPAPRPDDPAVAKDGKGRKRTESQARAALEKAERQRWRLLLIMVKGRLDLIALGVETVQQAFLNYVVLPGGGTVGEHVGDKLAAVLAGHGSGELLALPPFWEE